MGCGVLMAMYAGSDPLWTRLSGRLSIWLSRDPIEESGGINLYGYVDNAPNNYFDELGLEESAITYNSGNPKVQSAKAFPATPGRFTVAGEGSLKGPLDTDGRSLVSPKVMGEALKREYHWDGKTPVDFKQCLSGYAPPGQKSFAEQFRDLWGVETTGINGYHQYLPKVGFKGIISVGERIIGSSGQGTASGPVISNPGTVVFPAK